MKIKIILAAAILLVGVIFIYKFQPSVKRQSLENLTPEEQTSVADRAILKNSKSNDYEVNGALLRLAVRHPEEVRPLIEKNSKASSKALREGAAEALGYYDDAAVLVNLKMMLADAEESVRMAALRGIGHRRSAEREALIKEHLSKLNLSEVERLETSGAILASSNPKDADFIVAIDSLARVVRTATPELSQNALVKMTGYAPQDSKTIQVCQELIEKKIEKTAQKIAETQGIAIRHLAGFDATWVRARIDSFLRSPFTAVKLAAIQSIHGACPANRWDELKNTLKTETDKTLQIAAIQEAGLMPGPAAGEFMQWVNQFTSKDSQLAAAAFETVERLKKVKYKDNCESPN